MKAIVCTTWGGPEHLVLDEVSPPVAGEGEVRVALHACGLNFADTLIIEGKYQVRPEPPFVPGMEMAGEVVETGPGVSGFAPGDRVLGRAQFGGYAEEAALPAAALHRIPTNMPYEHAAGFAVTYGTAHLGLTRRAALRAGEVLLVHGAAGGVGLAAVEIGKHLGATVIATAGSDEKLALAARYGADHLINYRETEFRDRVKDLTDGRGANVVFDPVGGDVFDQSLRCIAWEGRILIVGFAAGRIPQIPANLPLVKNISIVGLFWGNYAINDPATGRESLETLLAWYADGKLRPHISLSLPLADAPRGLEAMRRRELTGKAVVTMR